MFSKSFTWTDASFFRFDCPFVAYGTVEVRIERIQLWALYIFFLERNKSLTILKDCNW